MMETILRRTALICAVLMLLGVMSDRTTWVRLNRRGQTITDGAAYNLVAFLTGIVVLISLAFALNTRSHPGIRVLSLVVAILAFGISVFVSGLGVWARLQGEIWAYGVDAFAKDLGPKWAVYPASGPFIFTSVAVLGAVATIGLGLSWLREARRPRKAPWKSSHPVTGGNNA
jgi:hypothetical protein